MQQKLELSRPVSHIWPGVFFRRDLMTHKIALMLGFIILVAIAIDIMLAGTGHMVFLGKRLFELIDWIAFWR